MTDINLKTFEVRNLLTVGSEFELDATFQSFNFPNEQDTLALLQLGILSESFNRNWLEEYDPIRVANIIPLPKNRFDIVPSNFEGSRRAAITRVINYEGALVDLLALELVTKWTSLFLGSVSIVGEHNFTREPHLGEGFMIHRNAASFLASGRRGAIVFDTIKARESLMAFTGPKWPIIVEDYEIAQRLYDKVAWKPSIRVNKKAFDLGGVK